jgi:membrane fusion protein (multidrug efflux system)
MHTPTPSLPNNKTNEAAPVVSPVSDHEALPRATFVRRAAVVIGIAVLFGALFVFGLVPRLRAQRTLREHASTTVVPSVAVFSATRNKSAGDITLPGDVQANQETGIYARASGYVKGWKVDIGDHVKAGQVLAELETPEIDQELSQARAALAQAKANRDLAASNLVRWKALSEQNAVSKQELEERTSTDQARAADVTAAEANVQRLEQLTAFKNITAPFDGTITARGLDVGSLVAAGGGKELFHLQQTQPLRVFVDVPQTQMRAIAVGQTSGVSVREFPGRVFPGKITRFAGALDRATRTMRTEILVDNTTGDLLSGVHADVKLTLSGGDLPFVVPATAIIIRNGPPLLATVDADNKVKLQPVTLGRDLGSQIEVLAGVVEGARVVTNPADTLRDGDQVQVIVRG